MNRKTSRSTIANDKNKADLYAGGSLDRVEKWIFRIAAVIAILVIGPFIWVAARNGSIHGWTVAILAIALVCASGLSIWLSR